MTEVYNLDFDEELLSHLHDPDAWDVLRAEKFRTDLIIEDEVKEIYEWQAEFIHRNGKPATASVLAEEFALDYPESETAIGDLIEKMRVRYIKNNGREVFSVIKEVFEEDPSKLSKIMIQKGRELDEIVRHRGEEFGTGEFDRSEQLYWDKTKQGRGASLGFKELDEHVYQMTGVTFFIAPPKTWKSWFVLNAEIENAKEGRFPYLHSLELPAYESQMRMQCMLANVPWWKFLRNALTSQDLKMMREAAAILDEMGIYKINKPPQGERSIDQLVAEAQDAGADSIFIDQLQYVEVDGQSLGAWNKTEKFWKVLNRARDLSDEIPICFVHQFNREADGADSMPSVKMAKSSAAIEETATLAIGMWANKDMRASSVCEMGVILSRNYTHQLWEVGIELSRGCKLDLIGRKEEE